MILHSASSADPIYNSAGLGYSPGNSVTVNVTDNDPPPMLSIGDMSVSEGSSGSVLVEVKVSLSGRSAETVTVGVVTEDETGVPAVKQATANVDYVALLAPTILTWPAGASGERLLVIELMPDVENELDEVFSVQLYDATNASIVKGHGLVTILDDD